MAPVAVASAPAPDSKQPAAVDATAALKQLRLSESSAHPLDPLSSDEISAGGSAVRAFFTSGVGDSNAPKLKVFKIGYLTLVEPPKLAVLASLGIPTSPGSAPETVEVIKRKAGTAVIDELTGDAYEVSVEYSGGEAKVTDFVKLSAGVQPGITLEELVECEETVRNDPVVQKLGKDIVEFTLAERIVFTVTWNSGHLCAGASFAENFYGLKRRRRPVVSSERARAAVQLTTNNEKLRKRDIRLSLLFLIGIPYLRAKAQDLYERLGGGVDEDLFQESPSARRSRASVLQRQSRREALVSFLRKYYKLLYPYVNVLYEIVLLGYNIGYLFDKTPYWRPWLSLTGVDIRRMGAQDYREASNSLQEHLSSPLRRHHATGLPPSYSLVALRYILLVPRLAFEALKIVLPTSIFFFKFLEWWYSSDYARTRRGGKRGKEEGSQPPIKAPTRLEPHPDSEVTKRGGYKMGVCPVHDGEIVNATALPSGYVACYRCAHGYVVENGRCPVTFLPAEVGDLRKVVG